MIQSPLPQHWWPSPAKLNLFLHINGQNEKGYHLLQTLFQLVDIGDQLAFEVTDDGAISIKSELEGVAQEDNLIYKAAKQLQQLSGSTLGCNIWLDKQLPMGGGIGGGSSNAATTLVALNALWKTKLSESQLADIGLTLGADVPIFIYGKTAFAEGVGEKITATELPSKFYLIVFPNCHVSTAEIFAADDLIRNSAKIAWQDYEFTKTRNDCQKLVCDRYPKVANLLRQLLEYAPSRMTGTGACLFSVFDTFEQAEQVKRILPEDCQAFVAKGINTSPLHEYLAILQLTSA
ncbi:4-(cytidine 5'-diphospho)-2-C-methyl-D-erythritol kinase [Aliiglaciecola lipolytica]|uniref:4-(cytidine 5'-diphospho)-2-C-methyl-D-erythritol kinase n=1 Tax=Aliiglaciecola lipolytica TaxID=477689 RepID=UPI001C095C87|nr:4-(cytidine 5'-diphospho)-2-C-methyl-D-erythritol kinase [Aliiglaciecola lipolytica]MBU2880032.1 4-(cytidine 5'-diphospho)-2-C-methyl-D-erythritol kinase [Aliiglaciecola lipolytica]